MDRTKRRVVGVAANSKERCLHWQEKKVNSILKKAPFPELIDAQGDAEKQRKSLFNPKKPNRSVGTVRGGSSGVRDFSHLRTNLTRKAKTSEVADENSVVVSKKHTPVSTLQARNRPMKETADRVDALNRRTNSQTRRFHPLQLQKEKVHKQQKQLLQQQKHLQQQQLLHQPRHQGKRTSQGLRKTTRAGAQEPTFSVKNRVGSNDGRSEEFSKRELIKEKNEVPLYSYETRQGRKTRSNDFAAARKKHRKVDNFRKCEQVQTVEHQGSQRVEIKKAEAPVKQKKTEEDVGKKNLFSKSPRSSYSNSSNHTSRKSSEESARKLHERWRSSKSGNFCDRSSTRSQRGKDSPGKDNIISCSSSRLEPETRKGSSKRSYQNSKDLKHTVSQSSRSSEGSKKSCVQKRTLQRSSTDSKRLRSGEGKKTTTLPVSPSSLKRARKIIQLNMYQEGNLSDNESTALRGKRTSKSPAEDAAEAYESDENFTKESSSKEGESSEDSVGDVDFGIRVQPTRLRKATRYKTLLETAKRKGKETLEKDLLLDTYFFSGRKEDFCEEEDDDWTPQKVYGFENAKRRLCSKQSESSSSDDEEDDDDDDSGSGDSCGARHSDSDTTEEG